MSSPNAASAYTYASTLEITGTLPAHLRQLALSDAEEGFELIDANREYLKQGNEHWPDLIRSIDDMESYLGGVLEEQAAGNSLRYWLVEGEVGSKGSLMGQLSLFEHNPELHQAFCGCWIVEDGRHMEYVTHGSRALLDYAAQPEVWGLQQVVAHITRGNVESQKRAQALGFTTSGTHRLLTMLAAGGKVPIVVQEWTKQL